MGGHIREVLGFKGVVTVKRNSKEVEQIVALSAGKTYDKVDFEAIRKPYFINYEEVQDNERLLKQKGSFIIFGTDDTPEIQYSSVYIINKEKILEELSALGYNEMTLVPELEHICHHIKQKLSQS